jgi:hypothetical protein
LTDYLRYQQHNALLLSVTHSSQNDWLELLLRLFDREDLVLVPELQFTAPLQAIERLLHESPEASRDLQLVDAAGWTRAESNGVVSDGPAPERATSHNPAGYNILSPRVQQAVLDVTRELVER